MIFYNNLLAKFGDLGRYGSQNPCKAVLGMLLVDVATRFGLVVVFLMVVDVASLCDLPYLLLVGKVVPSSLCL